MTFDLEGKVVAVTGASRGIGAGIADRLLAAGARVLGVSRTPAGLGGAGTSSPAVSAPGVSRTPDRALGQDAFVHLQCDLRSPDTPEVVLAAALDAFGRLDALVNNAGVLIDGACWEQSDADWDTMVEVNLTAPFRLSQRLAAHWIDGGIEGVIVNVCSIESQVAWASPPHAAYAATKGGLLGLTRALALELAPHGVRVVAVGPGAIATAMTPDARELTEAIPLGQRLGRPEEIGDLTAFLISGGARYITGEIVYADGGYLLT